MSVNAIETMVEWIENNIMNHPTLSEMSDVVGYSPYYCSVKFHEIVGITFKQYIARRRMNLASEDVIKTDVKFLDIALKYGFSSQEAFTRAFTSEYGCTPYQFRKKTPAIIPPPNEEQGVLKWRKE
ncbi:MAG: transcriptional regulator, AraC family [Anaerocolumna sp.]|nr:transcriptional regulator, AraC family [Anaerocolumna sp.]